MLKPQGQFTQQELGDYLDALEALADWWGQKQIDIESIDTWFRDVIRRIWQHPEVRAYIHQQQHEGADFYSGFEELAKTHSCCNVFPAPAHRRGPRPSGY